MERTKFIVASKNKDKIKEIKEILKDLPFEVVSMEEVGFDEDIVEDADTFEGNALIKARAISKKTNGYIMADDSGLCVEALDGAPGIYSARFAGENSSYDVKINKLWEMLDESKSKNRNAKFVCAIAVIKPDGSEFTVRGEFKGVIHDEIIGDNGFGYDPVFFLPEFNMTSAQISPELKNKISHRGIALRKMHEILQK